MHTYINISMELLYIHTWIQLYFKYNATQSKFIINKWNWNFTQKYVKILMDLKWNQIIQKTLTGNVFFRIQVACNEPCRGRFEANE